jgi:hypothetical protein
MSSTSNLLSSAAVIQQSPPPVEQQLIDFYVNGTPANDVTNPNYGTGNNSFQTGSFASYHGPGQGPNDPPIFPGGFQTTSSGPGAISEADGHGVARAAGTSPMAIQLPTPMTDMVRLAFAKTAKSSLNTAV